MININEPLDLGDWVIYRKKIYEIINIVHYASPLLGEAYIGVNVETKKTYQVSLRRYYDWKKIPKGDIKTIKLLYF